MYMYMQDGQTALYIASRKGHGPVVRLLLQTERADVNISKKVRHKCYCLYTCTLPLAQQYRKTSVIQRAWDWRVAVTMRVYMYISPACASTFHVCMCTHGCNAGLIHVHVHAKVSLTNITNRRLKFSTPRLPTANFNLPFQIPNYELVVALC